ncbi:unnamed protein product [Plutella xylostella]|uniref:(diamondback moth) hypothetical protein n=1 Tax=Plutella xylostella TaxID=51655 RepID=A0A8S4G916_PLUXY|nr:unnamed protein product [Plutella xylostella]
MAACAAAGRPRAAPVRITLQLPAARTPQIQYYIFPRRSEADENLFHSHRDSEVRVTRGCGWVRHHRECYKADNADHLETVCQCFEDHCNGSGRVNAALAVAAMCAFGRLLLY